MELGKDATGLSLSLESRATSPRVEFSVQHWVTWVGKVLPSGERRIQGPALVLLPTATELCKPAIQLDVILGISRGRRKIEGVEFAFS